MNFKEYSKGLSYKDFKKYTEEECYKELNILISEIKFMVEFLKVDVNGIDKRIQILYERFNLLKNADYMQVYEIIFELGRIRENINIIKDIQKKNINKNQNIDKKEILHKPNK